MNLSTLCIEKQDPYPLVSLNLLLDKLVLILLQCRWYLNWKSIFGAAKGFEVGGINIPGQIPVIDTADPEVEQRGVKKICSKVSH